MSATHVIHQTVKKKIPYQNFFSFLEQDISHTTLSKRRKMMQLPKTLDGLRVHPLIEQLGQVQGSHTP